MAKTAGRKPKRGKSTRKTSTSRKTTAGKTRAKKPVPKPPAKPERKPSSEGRSFFERMEGGVWGLGIAVLAVLILLALLTYRGNDVADPEEVNNVIGPVGAWLAHIVYLLTGAAGTVLAALAIAFGALLIAQRTADLKREHLFGSIVILFPLMILLSLFWFKETRLPQVFGVFGFDLRIHGGGGIIGFALSGILEYLVSTTGTVLLALGAVVAGISIIFRIHVKSFFLVPYRLMVRLAKWLVAGRRREDEDDGETGFTGDEDGTDGPSNPRVVRTGDDSEATNMERPAPAPPAEAGTRANGPGSGPTPKEPAPPAEDAERTNPAIKRNDPDAIPESADAVIDTDQERKDGQVPARVRRPKPARLFQLPELSLLDEHESLGVTSNEDTLLETARRLTAKLEDMRVDGVVGDIHPGPVIALFEFKPGRGIKLSTIEGLYKDVTMAVEAEQVRVIAPIPGRDVVGFEIPNKVREMVYLRETLIGPAYREGNHRLPLVLGKDIGGNITVTDFTKMPHLLVAGTTGSGKSVALHSFIMSILYKLTPDQVRFVMVDTKMLELTAYEGIPHLLLPVVTDSGRATISLKWAVSEMERRNRLMHEARVPNIFEYNQMVRGKQAKPHLRATIKKITKGTDGERREEVLEADEEVLETLPYIVVVIDELADLMMVAGKQVETYIARLAQMARAAGIHMIIATQNPTIKVVTGIIKANLPSRIAFKVRTMQDSRVILDQNGADCLLGYGDMLFLGPGSSSLQRIHGAYVSTKERNRVVKHLLAQGAPEYNADILRVLAESEKEEEESLAALGPADDLYAQALIVARAKGKISTSALQRELGIGYPKAAKFMSRMEKEGLVGEQESAGKPRDFLG